MSTTLVVSNAGSNKRKYIAVYVLLNAIATPVCLALGTVKTADQITMKDHLYPSITIFFAFICAGAYFDL